MGSLLNLLAAAVPLGLIATALLDAWSVAAKWLFGLPSANWSLVGRWIGHFKSGVFRHDRIADAASVDREAVLGWAAHYAIGIAFALVLLLLAGIDWLREPTLLPALAFGLSTVAAPFLLMQPGMGLGIAASRAPHPWRARLRSLLNHAIFGASLYAGALALNAAGLTG